MTAHVAYPQLDATHPATLSRRILHDLLRRDWGYKGVIVTDSLHMQAIRDRYAAARAALLALQAGADMVMALGAPAEQAATVEAIAAALADGTLSPHEVERSRRRLDALAARFPARRIPYARARRDDDERLMWKAWALALTAIGNARPPRLDLPLRVVTQECVPGDGVSEAGPSGDRIATLFSRFRTVDMVQVDDLSRFDWGSLPKDGVPTVLASNHRLRYGATARRWRPALHLALWNPFQVLDIPAPAIVTWGFADAALDALKSWLQGHGSAPGRSPVPLAPPRRRRTR